MNMECEKDQMDRYADFKKINEVSFVLDDLRLYLDTHPACGEANEMYNVLSAVRKKLLEDYTEKYGPIEAYSPSGRDWSWNRGNLPWEGVY